MKHYTILKAGDKNMFNATMSTYPFHTTEHTVKCTQLFMINSRPNIKVINWLYIGIFKQLVHVFG